MSQEESIDAALSRPSTYYYEHHDHRVKTETAGGVLYEGCQVVFSNLSMLFSKEPSYFTFLALASTFAALALDIPPVWMVGFISLTSFGMFHYLRL